MISFLHLLDEDVKVATPKYPEEVCVNPVMMAAEGLIKHQGL